MRVGFATVVLSLGVSACGPHAPETAYLNTSASGDAKVHVRDANVDNLADGSSSLMLGDMRLRPEACSDLNIAPEYRRIGASSLDEFLSSRGYSVEKVPARDDLVYYDVRMKDGSTMRLRVATLGSATEAARDLHQAVLEHGPGSWGVHRSNVAVLAPIGNVSQIVALAVETKLACWGVLTLAGRDDVFVVPGGYVEL